MTNINFQNWLEKLKKSGKTDVEINKILSGVAKYSGMAIYEAIMLTLSEKEMGEVEEIDSQTKAMKKIEELFKEKNKMTIDEFVGEIQKYLIEY